MVIQSGFGKHIDNAAARAGFGIASAIYHARNACMHDGAGAHQARLKRDIQFAAWQAVVAQRLSRRAQRHHFSVGRWVVRNDRLIVADGHHFIIQDHHGANGHFACGTGVFGLESQRQAHEMRIARRRIGPLRKFRAGHRTSYGKEMSCA